MFKDFTPEDYISLIYMIGFFIIFILIIFGIYRLFRRWITRWVTQEHENDIEYAKEKYKEEQCCLCQYKIYAEMSGFATNKENEQGS